MRAMSRDLLRGLPKVDDLLRRPALTELAARLPRSLVVDTVRQTIERRRAAILGGDVTVYGVESLEQEIVHRVEARLSPGLRTVVNATGVVLHTNLGRAPLDRQLLAEAADVAAGYSNLEYDLETRQRGSRYSHTAELLCHLTGAEASLVVNNNAAAMVLMLSALARGREVVVSRGELIEIGGSFRLPEIFETGGARLREVGATNRTRLGDYRRAIGPETAMLLKVHRSNFAIVGFTEEVAAADLVALAHEHGLVACEDLGSGCMVDLSPFGIESLTVQGQVAAGLDLVTFSGDKLLGGPQAGVIVGRKDLLERLRAHPLTRAFRVDKLTLATLERTLLSYADGSWRTRLPTLGLLTTPIEALEARAKRLGSLVAATCGDRARVSVEAAHGMVGGGALPETTLASFAVRVLPLARSITAVDTALRAGTPPILGRIADDALLLDVRAIFDADVPLVADRVASSLTAFPP